MMRKKNFNLVLLGISLVVFIFALRLPFHTFANTNIKAEIIAITPKGVTFETDAEVYEGEQLSVVRNGKTVAVLQVTEIKGKTVKTVFVEKYKEVDFEDTIERGVEGDEKLEAKNEKKVYKTVVPEKTITNKTPLENKTPKQPIQLVPQSGHSEQITSVTFSPDSRLLATTSTDKSIKIWDVLTGKELRTLKHKWPIYFARFTSDGNFIVAAGRIWEAKTGKVIRNIDIRSEEAASCMSLDSHAQLKLGDLDYDKLIKKILKEKNKITSMVVNAQCDHLALSNDKGSVDLWDLKKGKLVRNIKFAPVMSPTYGEYIPEIVALIQPKSQPLLIITASWNDGATALNANTGKIIWSNKTCGGGHFAQYYITGSVSLSPDGSNIAIRDPTDDNICILEASSGKSIYGLEDSHNSLAFSPDGRLFATAGDPFSLGESKTIDIWDVKTWKKIRTFGVKIEPVLSVAFSPNGNRVVSRNIGEGDNTKLWDVSSGRIMQSVNSFSTAYCYSTESGGTECKKVSSGKFTDMPRIVPDYDFYDRTSYGAVEFTPDGFYVALADTDGPKLWDLRSGKLEDITADTIEESDDYSPTTAISKDGQFLVVPCGKHRVPEIFDLYMRKIIKSDFEDDRGFCDSVALSPDGTLVAVGGGDKSGGQYSDYGVRTWDVNSGKTLYDLKIKSKAGDIPYISAVAFSPDSSILATGSWDYTIKLWNARTGTPLCTLVIGSKINLGQSLVGNSSEGKWETQFGYSGSLSRVTSIAFSPDGRVLASAHADNTGGLDNTVKLWDVQSCKILRIFKGHSSHVTSVAFSPDGRYLANGSLDGAIEIWNLQNNQKITLVSAGDEWLIYTDDGYFDASRNGGELVAMVQGLTPFSVDQFALRNNRPDIILKRMGLGHKDLIAHFYAQYQKRLKKAGFTEEQLSSELHVPEAKILNTKQDGKFVDVSFKLKDSAYSLRKYNIFVNDVPLYAGYGKEINGQVFTGSEKIELTSGKNKIEVSCINEKGAESYRALTYADYNENIKGKLYFIGFGVSSYQNAEINLKYADKDVSDLADTFSKMKGAYDYVVIKTFLNEEVTVENIKKAKELLSNAKVDDTVVLFIAGHGMYARSEDATYYYLTYNADLNNLSQTAADFDLIEDILQGIAPRKKLFLMDTCESGEIEDDQQNQFFKIADSRGIKPRTTRAIMVVAKKDAPKRTYLYQKDRYIYNDLSRRSGAIVFSSSRGGEFSYESDALQNGLFTKEIIKGLNSNEADKDGDGVISTDELRDYVSVKVSEMTDNLQHPTVDRDNIYAKFGFKVAK